MFENRVVRNTCAPKREEVTGDWRRAYVENLHGLYSSNKGEIEGRGT